MLTKTPKGPFSENPIAAYIAEQVEIQSRLGRTQRDIATAIGYDKPNMISMFKTGVTKVPLEKIPALAKALDVDPAYLFRLAIQQYWPELSETIDEIFGAILTQNEAKYVRRIRELSGDTDPNLTDTIGGKLAQLFK
jgi:transcriptional regulator with XRE-family HTH domain